MVEQALRRELDAECRPRSRHDPRGMERGSPELEEVHVSRDVTDAEYLLPDLRDLGFHSQRSGSGLSSTALSPSSVIQADRSSIIVELALFGTIATRSPTARGSPR